MQINHTVDFSTDSRVDITGSGARYKIGLTTACVVSSESGEMLNTVATAVNADDKT